LDAPLVAAVALGSNLGDRRSHLMYALSKLDAFIAQPKVSRFYETVPVGVRGPQSLFLNAVLVGATELSARQLLDLFLAIESDRGRERPFPGAARTLDLDLVLLGDQVIDEPGLSVPHPRFRERRFVLEPLVEIAPALRDPVTGKSVRELLELIAE
jgi:2-amino-4-hydroxy-6-hydroxymethyldihydropteridine diphosphokinase